MTDDTEDASATVLLTAGDDASANELRSLQTWLNDVDEVRGRAELREGPPVPGTLGPVVDGLLVTLGPGGAVTALATALVAWIRHRRSEVTLKVTRGDGASFEVSAKRVQLLSAAELRGFVGELAAQLASDETAARPDADAGPS
ncbi:MULTISPECIES: effector-associated constant component EACC1 [Streptomyces]|uniref:Uncharacterized protein n=1 Tax=Streptomyces kaempferi TaxID=333725 RepID=A0ABW3XKP9_9ACTN|nr:MULTISPECIES: hypothetical protein [unclassified Streptomyces]QIY60855.1 hypothetical protein HEP85_03045 [Streptomyces sp. RPA4-2]